MQVGYQACAISSSHAQLDTANLYMVHYIAIGMAERSELAELHPAVFN